VYNISSERSIIEADLKPRNDKTTGKILDVQSQASLAYDQKLTNKLAVEDTHVVFLSITYAY